MALPAVTSLGECADFSKTVAPYIPQLYTLPQQLLDSWSNPDELKALYIATNPLISAFTLASVLCPLLWIASVVNRNYSQVDRIWSILPTIYIGHFVVYAHLVGLETERLDSLLICFVIWSIRLTHNYWRKGGYSIGSEDYRWEFLKSKMNSVQWFFFNIVFIAAMQSALLFIISTPAYVLLLVTKFGLPLSKIDTITPRAIIGFILIEALADHQQWGYQTAKAKYKATAKVPMGYGYEQEDLDRGFIVTGLFGVCRHPNFACEQAIWIGLYQWSCLITDQLYNWTGFGALLYVALFQASTWLTEKLSVQKYPEYKEYQQRVAKFIPKLSSELPGDSSEQPAEHKGDGKKDERGRKGSRKN